MLARCIAMEKEEVTGHSRGCVTSNVEVGMTGASDDEMELGSSLRADTGKYNAPELRACSAQVR